jgi:hypothetical protein
MTGEHEALKRVDPGSAELDKARRYKESQADRGQRTGFVKHAVLEA